MASSPRGATAADSLLLSSSSSVGGVIGSVSMAFGFGGKETRKERDPLPLLGNILIVLSGVVTILSSEAVGIRLGGRCKVDDFTGCYMSLGVFLAPARALQVLVGAELGMVLCAGVYLWRYGWFSGVGMAQGSLAATAALMQSEEIRRLFKGIKVTGGRVEVREVVERCERWRFKLGYFPGRGGNGEEEYGVVTVRDQEEEEESAPQLGKEKRGRDSGWSLKGALEKAFNIWPLSIRVLIQHSASRYGRISERKMVEWCGFLYIAGLIILVTYYTAVQDPDTAFERFMDGQAFGVRVLFTAFGVALTFFWNRYYARKCLYHPPFSRFTLPPASPFKTIKEQGQNQGLEMGTALTAQNRSNNPRTLPPPARHPQRRPPLNRQNHSTNNRLHGPPLPFPSKRSLLVHHRALRYPC